MRVESGGGWCWAAAAALCIGGLTPSRSGAQPQDLEAISASGFEAGNLDGWQASTDGGDLSASATAAMVGAFGLQAVVNDTAPLYVQDDLWTGMPYAQESYFHASFRFDPNGFDPGEGAGALRTRIFIGFQADPQRRLFSLVLRRRDGQFAIMARVREDDGGQVDTGFVDVTDAPHLIAVEWHQSGSASATGVVRLSVDGSVVATLNDIENSVSGIDFVRLGALSVKNGASGALYFDDYTTFRDLAPARAQLVLNEVDYDQPGPDVREFVEVYNPGPAMVEAWLTQVLLINGANHGLVGSASRSAWLQPGGYLVFASPLVAVAPGAQRSDWVLDQDMVPNGSPDGVVLAYVSGDYSHCQVIDALSYEGQMSVPLRPCGLVNLVEGTPLGLDDADSDVISGSLVRLPNGSDTNDAATDWTFSTTPTPGAPNVP